MWHCTSFSAGQIIYVHGRISPYQALLTHRRFLLTLRSQEGYYHSLILFRLSTPSEPTHNAEKQPESPESNPAYKQLYAMESSCPHLGADLSHAEIEECETSYVAVCPWHRCVFVFSFLLETEDHRRCNRYDFDLRTGNSETGLKACTYAVEVREEGSGNKSGGVVYIETPTGGHAWKLVELRPVSEGPSTILFSSTAGLCRPRRMCCVL